MRVWLREHAQRHNNLLVVVPSTPAQYFHCLRRQLLSEYQKPLVLVTPKSIMHHRPCKSGIEEFGPGTGFQPVLGHEHGKHDVDPQDVRRVLMCTGQVYFALRRTRAASKAWVCARSTNLAPPSTNRAVRLVSTHASWLVAHAPVAGCRHCAC